MDELLYVFSLQCKEFSDLVFVETSGYKVDKENRFYFVMKNFILSLLKDLYIEVQNMIDRKGKNKEKFNKERIICLMNNFSIDGFKFLLRDAFENSKSLQQFENQKLKKEIFSFIINSIDNNRDLLKKKIRLKANKLEEKFKNRKNYKRK